jgi:hypothetical protein
MGVELYVKEIAKSSALLFFLAPVYFLISAGGLQAILYIKSSGFSSHPYVESVLGKTNWIFDFIVNPFYLLHI